jgi:hypothetical protein
MEANRLHRTVLHAIGNTDVACAARFSELLESDVCRPASGVIANASFAAGAFPPARTAVLVDHAVETALSGDHACVREILPAVQQAGHIDASVRAAVSRAANANDGTLADAGWLVLGTVAKIARESGDHELASEVDASIATALRVAPADRRVSLLEAAGNAGCQACTGALEEAASASDAWVRRAAAGAWRFVPSGVRSMCRALRGDASAMVREHAAWALGLSNEDADADLRVACLTEAASSDANEDVRRSATRSLERSAP